MKTNLSSQITLTRIPTKYYRPENAFEHSVLTRLEKVPTTIYESAEEGSFAIAKEIALQIRKKQDAGLPFVLALPGGRSPESVYKELVRMHREDNLSFRNPLYNQILATYREHWQELGTGVEVPVHYFLNHPDPEVCNASVDILTSDDNYVASELWKRKEVHVESEAEMLAVGVPKAVMLYKSKVIDGFIKELRAQLEKGDLSEDETSEIMQRMTRLNAARVSISHKLQRTIL